MNSCKFIGAWTSGMMSESGSIREQVEKEFNKAWRVADDWLYSVEVAGRKFFIADNGERGYTAMLPEEY